MTAAVVSLDEASTRSCAAALHSARLERQPRPMLTETHPGLTVADAYRIQDRGIGLRMADGERVVVDEEPVVKISTDADRRHAEGEFFQRSDGLALEGQDHVARP